jgi:uncharacterized protein YycO
MKKLIAILALAGIVFVAQPVPNAEAKTTGTYPTRRGTILVTTDPWFSSLGIGFGFGHTALVLDGNNVVEAVNAGVIKARNNWTSARTKVTGLTVTTTSVSQDSYAATWASSHIGKPYNYNFYDMGNRKKFYCSQLVWASFKDPYSIDLNTWSYDFLGLKAIAPTELVSTSLTSTIYTQS